MQAAAPPLAEEFALQLSLAAVSTGLYSSEFRPTIAGVYTVSVVMARAGGKQAFPVHTPSKLYIYP